MEGVSYLDFDLLIQRAGTNYRAQVVNSPAGQAALDFSMPFSDLELENFLLRIGRPVRGLRRIDSPEVEAAKVFGQRLFSTIFNEEVRACLRSSLDEANRQGLGLRIRLRLTDVPELADLPWEYLYNPALNRFLTLSVTTPIVRYLDLPERISPLAVTLPLRVLVMISSPSDYPKLDVEREWGKLREALGDLDKRGLLTLERLEDATLASLQQQLRRGEYHIFHFIGHGGFDQRLQDGVLILEDEDERGRPVSGQDLGTLMHDHRPLRLAILNACEGARTSRTDPFAGMAQSLVQQGIPAVIAIQFEITDEAAIIFAHEFYGAIADGYPVDAALAEARKSIFAQGNTLEWGTPVLYLRSPDGVLFSIQKQAEAKRLEQEREDKKQAEAKQLEQERQESESKKKAARDEAERKEREKVEIERLSKSARELQDKGRLDEALETWKKVIEVDPKNAEALQAIQQIEQEKKKIAELEAKKRILIAGQPRKWPKIAAVVFGVILALIIGYYIRGYIISNKKITVPPPEILGYSAEPSTIKKGEVSTLRWNTSNAKEVEISGIGKVSLSGSNTVSPTETTTYTIIARNKEGRTVEREVTIQVIVFIVLDPEILKFDAKPSTIKRGEPSILSWKTLNAKEVTIGAKEVGPSGSIEVDPEETTTYTLIATNEEGKTVEREVTVKVNIPLSPPEILYFGANSKKINKGSPSTVEWKTSNADEVTLVVDWDKGVDKIPVKPSGSKTYYPGINTTYTLIAKNEEGKKDERTITVEVASVRPPKILIKFSAKPSTIKNGEVATLWWKTSNAKEVYINKERVKPSGSKTVSPIETTTYTLFAANDEDKTAEKVTINVAVRTPEILKPPTTKPEELETKSLMVQYPERYIKITDWSFFVAFNGVANIHHVVIENKSDIAYKDIKVRVRYYSRAAIGAGRDETKTLPVTITPHSRETYLEGGFVLGAGTSDIDIKGIDVLGAVPQK
ncbi:MAG: CHAT domain-containing protein [Thermodesulfobacteriota bacterium]